MLILIACYIFILTMIIALEVIPVSIFKRRKRVWMIVLSALDIGLLTFVWLIQKKQEIATYIFLPLIVLGSSVYELYRESKEDNKIYYFSIPAHTYELKKQLGMDLIIKPKMKSTTVVLWEGKKIIMPQTFTSDGEALELACYRVDEIYYCKSVTTKEKKLHLGRFLMSLSLLVSVLAVPMCFYLSKVRPVSEYWINLGSGFATCLIFGFASQVLAGHGGSLSLRIVRVVIMIFYGIGILGIIIRLIGI